MQEFITTHYRGITSAIIVLLAIYIYLATEVSAAKKEYLKREEQKKKVPRYRPNLKVIK